MLSAALPYSEFQSLWSCNCPGEKGEVCFVSRPEVYCYSAELCPQNTSWFGFVPHAFNDLLNTHSQQLVLSHKLQEFRNSWGRRELTIPRARIGIHNWVYTTRKVELFNQTQTSDPARFTSSNCGSVQVDTKRSQSKLIKLSSPRRGFSLLKSCDLDARLSAKRQNFENLQLFTYYYYL